MYYTMQKTQFWSHTVAFLLHLQFFTFALAKCVDLGYYVIVTSKKHHVPCLPKLLSKSWSAVDHTPIQPNKYM